MNSMNQCRPENSLGERTAHGLGERASCPSVAEAHATDKPVVPATLKTTYLGQEMQSPFILSSGPLSYAAEGMIRAHQNGCGAVVTKTIRLEAAINPVNHIAKLGNDSLLNCEKWADIPWQQWCDREIPEAVAKGAIVIASVGQSADEAKVIAPAMEKAGASMIELVSYTEKDMLPMLAEAKKRCTVPVICKMSGNWPDPVGAALRCLEQGADGICAIDSIGPALEIDIENRKPLMHSSDGYAWMTGGVIRPISMRINAEIARATKNFKGLYGSGGCMQARHAVEFLMAGASAVGICTTAILHGLSSVQKLNHDLAQLLASLGYTSVADVVGAALPNFPSAEVTGRLHFSFTPFRDNGKKHCSSCGKCEKVCSYNARELNFPAMQVDSALCRDCGACVSICPTGALTASIIR